MRADTASRPAARCARVVQESLALKTEGAGNAGCPMHPQPVCIGSKHTVVTTVAPGSPGIPARDGFNGFLRALVSRKSARMCERAVVPQPPVAGSEPVRARRPESLTGSKGQIRCLPQPEQLHGLRARTEQGRELDDGTKRSHCRRYRCCQGQGGCVHSLVVSTADVPKHRGGTAVSGSRISRSPKRRLRGLRLSDWTRDCAKRSPIFGRSSVEAAGGGAPNISVW